MSNDTYTENLGDIMQCARERVMVAEILNAWNTTGLPETFYSEGARFAFNRNSGNVFLVNDEYQCAMMNDAVLESFYSTPYNGHAGFIGDLLAEHTPDSLHADDVEYILQTAKNEGAKLPEAWKTYADEARK